MRYSKEHTQRTRQRILEGASRVFRRKGFAGAGVDGVMAEVGLTSGAFYGHFAGKEQLLEEVVRRSVRANERTREAGLEDLQGRPWVSALLHRYLSEAHRAAVEQGCPIPTLVSELGRAGAGPQRAFAEAGEELVERVASHLEGYDEAEARRRALATLAMAVGGLALARAMGDAPLAQEVLAACAQVGSEDVAGDRGPGASS